MKRTKGGRAGLRVVASGEEPVDLAQVRALRHAHPAYRGLDEVALRLRLAGEVMEAGPMQLVGVTHALAGGLAALAGLRRSAPG